MLDNTREIAIYESKLEQQIYYKIMYEEVCKKLEALIEKNKHEVKEEKE